MGRRKAFGLISHITPIGLTIFIVLWYTPVIAAQLRVRGWSQGEAFGVGLLLPVTWLALTLGIAAVLPARFAKLQVGLECAAYGFPVLGMLALFIWIMAATLWRLAN